MIHSPRTNESGVTEERLQKLLSLAFQEHKGNLNLRALYKTGDAMLSEDLVQNTFLKTWVYLVRGGKIDLMKAFLNHVLNGLIIDEYRKKKPVSLDVLLSGGFEPSTDDFNRGMDISDGKNALLLIGKLPKKYQKVMRMRYMYDLSLLEMSTITGESKNTMSVQAHRGLEKLKVLYAHE
jgi:RNA polymerase sigma factor (sigma-70 family)